MRGTLVVVANASRARLLHLHAGRIEVLAIHTHAQSRARERDLISDRPGRTWIGPSAMGRLRGGTSHGMPRTGLQPTGSHREAERFAFARELAGAIAAQLRDNPSLDLALIAPPHFLGRLRAALPPAAQARTVATVVHDYTARPAPALLDALRSHALAGLLPVAEPV
jgi:hypothetical protein